MSETSGKTVRAGATGWRRVPPRVWVALVLAVLAVIFIAENRDPTPIRLIVPVVVMPLWAALAILFVVGVLVGLGLGRRRR
jgi:uncharacterized integral membrane protein